MAKLKKTARAKKPAAAKTSAAELQAKAEHLSRSLVESAQQIWMAGVGAFTRAQGEGSKLFEALVAEGMKIENTTRKLATGKVDAVRDAMEGRVEHVRGRASDTWDRLEKVFEDRVQRALNRLGIPGREDLTELSSRVDALTAQPTPSRRPRRPSLRAQPSPRSSGRRRPRHRPRRRIQLARYCRRQPGRSPRSPDSGCARQPV